MRKVLIKTIATVLSFTFCLLSFSFTSFAIEEDNDIPVIYHNEYALGDINDDGQINAKDSYIIKNKISLDEEFYSNASDLCADGKTNARDVLYLKAFLSGIITIESIDSDNYVYKFNICGKDISEFKFAYSTDSDTKYAYKKIGKYIEELSGISIPVKENTDSDDSLIHVIISENTAPSYSTKNGNLYIYLTKQKIDSTIEKFIENVFDCHFRYDGIEHIYKSRYASIEDNSEMVLIEKTGDNILISSNWNDSVKDSINKFVTEYNREGNYAIFDFENTCTTTNLLDMFIYYRLEYMCFDFSTREIRNMVSALMNCFETSDPYYSECSQLRTTVSNAYKNLDTKYGRFTLEGVTGEKAETIISDSNWLDFVKSMLRLSEISRINNLPDVFFYGICNEEVYSIALNAYELYKGIELSNKRINGVINEFEIGNLISGEINELWKTLSINNIDIWVCDSAESDLIRAAIDCYGLHNYCKGIIASQPDKDTKTTDFLFTQNGVNCPYITKANNQWSLEYTLINPLITNENILENIKTVCLKFYGCGPDICVVDSDSNADLGCFSKDIKLCICINTQSSDESLKVLSEYQDTKLYYDLTVSQRNNDTLYLTQGIDLNSASLINSKGTILKNELTEEVIFTTKYKDTLNNIQINTEIKSVAKNLGYDYHNLDFDERDLHNYNVDDTKSLELSILSFNIRFNNDGNGHSISERRPRVKSEIDNTQPDVIGFQEATPEWMEYIYQDYSDKYEIFNVWRDTGGTESTPLLWNKTKFECLEKGTFWLSEKPMYMSYSNWDGCYRTCLYAILRDRTSGKTIVAINTHVGFIELNQAKSTELIYNYAQKLSDYPTFVIGDFNFEIGTKGYTKITEFYTDVNAATINDTGETYHGYYNDPLEHVDYCFADKRFILDYFEVLRHTFDGKYASDHYPIWIKMTLK